MPYKQHHIEKKYYRSGEVASECEVDQTTVNNWARNYPDLFGRFTTKEDGGVAGSRRIWSKKQLEIAKVIASFFKDDKKEVIKIYMKGYEAQRFL